MALLTVQAASLTGLEMTTTAAAELGDTFVNDGRTVLYVNDNGTTAPTVTISSLVDCDQGETHDITVTVTSGEDRFIGPFPMNRFNDSSGLVSVTYDDHTDVLVAVMSVK